MKSTDPGDGVSFSYKSGIVIYWNSREYLFVSPNTSRRRFLAVAGAVAVTGCAEIRYRRERGPSATTPPLREFNFPLAYTPADTFSESVMSDWDPDDPPEVGNSDAAIDEPSFLPSEDKELSGDEVVFGIKRTAKPRPIHSISSSGTRSSTITSAANRSVSATAR